MLPSSSVFLSATARFFFAFEMPLLYFLVAPRLWPSGQGTAEGQETANLPLSSLAFVFDPRHPVPIRPFASPPPVIEMQIPFPLLAQKIVSHISFLIFFLRFPYGVCSPPPV